MKSIFNFLFACMMFICISCENQNTSNKGRAKLTIEKESHNKNGYQWYLLNYSDGTYGVEVDNNIILSNCENKIYIVGYNNDYAFKTKKGNDWYFYNMVGESLFSIPNVEFAIVNGFLHDGNIFKNAYILVEDSYGKEGVYSLDGKLIIEPQNGSISDIIVKTGKDKRAIYGFQISSNSNDKIYDYNGNFILSGQSIAQEDKGTCPIFYVEKSSSDFLYNYKGERIIDIDDYYDYDIEVKENGYSYIICESEYAYNEYYEHDEQLWLSVNGEVLKEEGTKRINSNVMSEDKKEFNRFKSELENHNKSLPRFNDSSSSENNVNSNQGNNTNSYYPPINNTGSDVYNYNNGDYNHGTSDDNISYWENFYNDAYNRYARLVESHISTLNTLISTSNGGATSTYAISETKSNIRNTQNDMRRVRNEAQQKGIYISESYLENLSFN